MTVKWSIARHSLGLRREVPSSTGGNLRWQERAYLRLQLPDGTIGYGELATHPMRPPTVEALVQQIVAALSYSHLSEMPIALQAAFLDAQARQRGLPLWMFLGWPPPVAVKTVESFGGMDVETVMAGVRQSKAAGIKLKIQAGQPWREMVLALVDEGRKIVLDPNGCWSYPEALEAMGWLKLHVSSLLWVEQPCPPGQQYERLKAPFPVLADEAVDFSFDHVFKDYDGILLKASLQSLTTLFFLADKAREKRLFLTAGCLLESSLTTALSLNLSGFFSTSWVDLDTVLLVENNPFSELPRPSPFQIALSEKPGLGVEPCLPMDWDLRGTLQVENGCLDPFSEL